MMAQTLDLALSILDRQLIDSQGRRCGRVDDIELAATPGMPARVTHLLVGRQVRTRRLPRPFDRLGRFGRSRPDLRIPWEAVESVTHVVKLRRTSSDLGLGKGDYQAARWLGRLPGAR
jgi:sporulation protein YlmC with PRC-barrel domain